MQPSQFLDQPMDSIFHKDEAETIFRNIMVILKRTGDTWRELPWDEYVTHRQKDGNFTHSERGFFNQVLPHTLSAEKAIKVCPKWRSRGIT